MNDPLTGVLRRPDLIGILEQALESTGSQVSHALLVVEINHFQRINLLYQYDAGDRVLQQFAEILRKTARPRDHIGRIGDSKFALLLLDISSEQHAKLAAFKILRLLEEAVHLEYVDLHFNVTIGIALFPGHAQSPLGLLREADLALDRAKRSKQLIAIADIGNSHEMLKQLDQAADLSSAIDNVELVIYFQPKIDASNGHPVGAEALIRWQHPEQGLLLPGQFLPTAESTGLIIPITEWVLNSALRMSRRWSNQWGPLSVSVNIPPLFIEQEDFVDKVSNIVGLWQAGENELCLEILESSYINPQNETHDLLKRIQAKGVRVSIDDFGTGYSSLSYFRDIPANELKVDRSFVLGLLRDEVNRKIVSLIIDMAHLFGLTVIAEGVENRQLAEQLKALDCDQFQGFYYSRPIPAVDFEQWLVDYQPSP